MIKLFHIINGKLEMSRFEGRYFDADGKPHYYLTDYQGNVVRVIDREGSGGQPMDYYPYGEPWQEWDWTLADTYPTFIKNRFLYGGKERITQFGLGLYNFEARMYRAQLGRFSTPDKKAIDTPWLSPFAYCACNPVNFTDPTGMKINMNQLCLSDKSLNRSVTQLVIDDLIIQTGLQLSLDDNGILQYEKNSDGSPVVNKTVDKNGKEIYAGSKTARKFLTGIIDNKKTVNISSRTGGSKTAGLDIGLDFDQINYAIQSAVGVDGNTLGFGMTLLHELHHSTIGGNYIDVAERFGTGDVVDNMNIIRNELNNQGFKYGQRMNYEAIPTIEGNIIPFNNSSLYSLKHGKLMNKKSHYIKTK